MDKIALSAAFDFFLVKISSGNGYRFRRKNADRKKELPFFCLYHFVLWQYALWSMVAIVIVIKTHKKSDMQGFCRVSIKYRMFFAVCHTVQSKKPKLPIKRNQIKILRMRFSRHKKRKTTVYFRRLPHYNNKF